MTMLGVYYYQWPGYREFKRQVQIKDETPARNPITVAKFAHHVGRSVEAFFRVSFLVLTCDMCSCSSYLNLHRGHNRIRRQVRLKGRNLIAGLSGRAGSTLLTLGLLVLSTFPQVAGCQSFSLMMSGFFNPLPQLGMTTTNLLSTFIQTSIW